MTRDVGKLRSLRPRKIVAVFSRLEIYPGQEVIHVDSRPSNSCCSIPQNVYRRPTELGSHSTGRNPAICVGSWIRNCCGTSRHRDAANLIGSSARVVLRLSSARRYGWTVTFGIDQHPAGTEQLASARYDPRAFSVPPLGAVMRNFDGVLVKRLTSSPSDGVKKDPHLVEKPHSAQILSATATT